MAAVESTSSCEASAGAGGDAGAPSVLRGHSGSSGGGRSDSGSVELPSALIAAMGDTRGSSSANLTVNEYGASSRVYGRSSLDFPQSAPLLPKVRLTPIDRQRLTTLAKLMKVEIGATALDCCEVFSNEILEDFPTQIFLQEPGILETLISIVESAVKIKEQEDLTINALKCLCKISEKLMVQLHKYQDPNLVADSEEVSDAALPHRSWSLLETCWAGLSTASLCLRTSDRSGVLVEALRLLRACLAIHTAFFPSTCVSELSRLSLLLADVAASKPPTFAYLQVLQLIKKYVTQRRSVLKQSDILKKIVQDAVINAGVWCLNPELAQEFIIILKDIPQDEEFWKIVGGVTDLCQALTSANFLITPSGTGVSQQMMEESLMSLDFLPDLLVTRQLVETMARAQGWETRSPLLALLAHANPEVQAQAYQHCHQVVLASIGMQQARDPISYVPDNVSFLADEKVLQEIVCFGLEHENQKVKGNAEDILVQMIRSRLLIPAVLWSKISSCLAFLIPILASKIGSSKALLRALLSYLNPESQNVDTFQCVRGNACLLFSRDEAVRTEATKRLLWIIEKHPQSFEKWPQISTILTNSEIMSSLCIVTDPMILSNNVSTIFYNESSLREIVGLLSEGCSEPSVRHSALCQLAAMLQEPRLLPAFLEAGGVEASVNLLDVALVQHKTDVLSKSVKPIIIILSRVLSTQISLCHTLAQDENLLFNLMRSMFLYSSIDPDFRQHHSVVLALLLFCDFLRQKPSQSSEERLVLPWQLVQGLSLPLRVGTYAKVSSHSRPDTWQRLRAMTGPDTKNLNLLLRCHLTLEKLGTLENKTEVERVGHLGMEEVRLLLQFDAVASLRGALYSIQTATSHAQVLGALPVLASYLPCPLSVSLTSLPWKESFARFLSQPPATQADATLLEAVVSLLAQHGAAEWVNCQDIASKLDPHQPSMVQSFLPLLQSSADESDESSAAQVIITLCRCLRSCEDSCNTALLRNVLQCLAQLTRVHNVQLSSRLMADFIAPLVNIVGRFSVEGSFVSYGLIEEALQCLCLIQTNNLPNFTHHLCAYSENCDIFNVLIKIISSDKTTAKASALSLLAGLATCNGMKNNTMDLAAYIQKSLSLAMDKNETCLVRQQAITFLSSVINNPVTIPDVDVFISVLSENQWFEHVSELGRNLYLKEIFQFSNFDNLTSPSGSPSNLLRQIVTPEYLASHFTFLYNLNVAAPITMMKKIKEFGLFRQALKVLSDCLVDTSILSQGICNLINQSANLLAFCLITDEEDELAKELRNFPYLPPQILRTLKLPEFEQLCSAIFWLLVAMEQAGHGAPFVLAFQQGLFWVPLCRALSDPELGRAALLLTRALSLQTKASRPAKASQEVDAGCARLCAGLSLLLQREETHQGAMAALAGLLAGWPEARSRALRQGLLESVVVALKHCLAGLLLVQDSRQLASTQAHPLIEELIDSFELLVGFLLNDLSIKKSASETILIEEVNNLWPFCLLNVKLRDATVKFLAVYTAGCEEACVSLLLRQQKVGGVKVKRCPSSTSLFHQVALLVVRELGSGSDSPLHLALRTLRQCCTSSECRAALAKTNVLREVFVSGSGLTRLPPSTQRAALLLVERFTRHAEGQLAVARIPEALESLSVRATEIKGDAELSLLATEILRNLCFCHANRVLLLTSGPVLTGFLQVLGRAGPPCVQLVATALWSLAANHHRSKQALKVAGFHQALSKARQRCGSCPDIASVLDTALDTLTAT